MVIPTVKGFSIVAFLSLGEYLLASKEIISAYYSFFRYYLVVDDLTPNLVRGCNIII